MDGHEEQHAYERRDDGRIVETDVHRLGPGQVVVLAEDAIHEVLAPPDRPSVALHVYGGALFDQPRHEWSGTPLAEAPIDDAAVLDRYLEALTTAGLD